MSDSFYRFQCPHCWEVIEMELEVSAGAQEYVQDCEVCCNPLLIEFVMERGEVVNFSASPAQ